MEDIENRVVDEQNPCRKVWVDQLRGIALLLMYMAHNGGWSPLYRFAMMRMVKKGVHLNVSINKYSNPALFIVFSFIGVYVYMMVVKSFNIGSFLCQ